MSMSALVQVAAVNGALVQVAAIIMEFFLRIPGSVYKCHRFDIYDAIKY